MPVSAIITIQSITIFDPVSLTPKAIPSSHPNFAQIRDLVEAGAEWRSMKDLVDLPNAIATYTNGRIAVINDVLTFDGVEVNNALSARILQLIADKKETSAEPLIKFMENVTLNPSMRAVDGLYDWLSKSNLPITPDGQIIAWKIVREDYRDIHSGKFDNSIGNIVQEDRNVCDEDPDRTCSSGLHFCSSDYLPQYGTGAGNRVVVVKVHPRDVVAFPRDYNTSKGRACRYEVIGEVNRNDAATLFNGVTVLREFGVMNDEVFSTLEVDGEYLDREGNSVEIVDADGHAEFPFIGDNGSRYTASGRYLGDDVELPGDLIKRVG